MISRRALIIGAALLGLICPARAAFNAFGLNSGGGGGGPATPTLVQHLGSTVNDNNGISGNGYIFTVPNTTLPGNFLIMGISFPYSASRTVSISDTTGDIWTQAGSQITDTVNMAQRVYVIPNATAGVHRITVTFDTALRPFEYQVSEFYNVALSSPVDGTHGTASVASPNVSAGSYTPTTNNDANGGHLIWTFARSNDKIGTLAANAASTIAPTVSAALLSADNTCTIPGACSYVVQPTLGAINPGFTITQSSGTNFVCSSVALKAASAGTAPPAGIRIRRILHCTYVLGGSTAVFQFPSDGNLLYTAMSAGDNLNPVSSVIDSNAQTYSNPGAAGNPQCYYHQNATPANNLKVTFAVGGTQFSIRLYDIVGAQASSFQNASGFNGAAPATGVINNFPNHTPGAAPGLSLQCGGFGTGPANGMAAGAPAGAIFDLGFYTGETDQDRMDNADSQAHAYISATTAQTWNFGLEPAAFGSTAFATACTFI